jgi:ribosomal protein S7
MQDQNMVQNFNIALIKKKYVVLKYINLFLNNGKKEKKESLFKLSLSYIKHLEMLNPIIIILKCIKKSQPFCEIKSIKIKGSLQKIPVEIKQSRQKNLIMRYLILNIKYRPEQNVFSAFSKEILYTIFFQSKTTKYLNELYKIAEINKIYLKK